MRRRPLLGAGLLGLGAGASAGVSESAVLRYARQGDPEADFFFHLLREVLAHSGTAWRLQPSAERVSHARALLEVEQGDGAVDVVWTMTSAEREQQLRPIRIPIDRGLFGWRVLLVRRGESARFAGVRSLADLRAFRFLQGHDWPDARILEANGLSVERSTNFDSLFPMLVRGRADALPRGAVEVAEELHRYGSAHAIELEPSLVLRYPTALYYFVSPKRPELAAQIERGLRALQANGRAERLLRQFYAEALALVKLPARRVITLHNPLLPPTTPVGEAGWWWR